MSILSKPIALCSGCPLYTLGEGFSINEGTGANGVLVVAEALGENELLDGLPLRPWGQAGSVFERAIKKAGYDRQDFGVTNQILCRPPGNKLEGQSYEAASIEHCYKNHFVRSLDQYRPRAILALGSVATRSLTGMAGRNAGISLIRGFVFDSRAGIPVVPSLHPAFIARGKAKFLNVLIRDIQYAVQIARFGVPIDRKLYLEHPTVAEAEGFLADCRSNSHLPIAYDIETDYSLAEPDESDNDSGSGNRIISIQFSLRPNTAIVFPWAGDYIAIAKQILGLDNPKWGWNCWTFDDVKLRQHGVEKIGGRSEDLMWGHHHLQPDLPRGLQFATSLYAPEMGAWKHLSSSRPEYYGGCFKYDTRIALWDGSYERIDSIVKNRKSLLLKGMDEEGSLIPVKSIDWRRVRVPGQTWRTIKTEGTNQPIYCTPDHLIWANGTWIPAEDVQVGDIVCSPNPGSSDLLHGTLLGDAHCDRRGRFSFSHCDSQKEYFEAKRNALNGPHYIIPSQEKLILGRACSAQTAHKTEVWVSRTFWRDRFYTGEGVKIFIAPPSDAALAVWYMDDGVWARGPKADGTLYRGNPRIIVQGFCNNGEAESWAKGDFNGEAILYRDKRHPSGGAIAFTGRARDDFFRRVAPFIHPSMDYKIPDEYKGQYTGWLEVQKAQETVVVSNDLYPIRRNPWLRYCLTVDHPTHRFFTMGGLVKNCDVDSLQRIGPKIFDSMDKAGIRRGYDRHIVGLQPILQRMCARGLPIDREARSKFRVSLEETSRRLDAEIQAAVPENLKGIHPALGYQNSSPTAVRLIAQRQSVVLNKGRERILPPALKEAVEAETGLKCKTFEDGYERFYKERPFLANSGQQLIRYMKAMGHKVPHKLKERNEDGSPKDSTEKKGLERLYGTTKDEFYLKVIELRELGKMVGTYVDGFEVDENDRVHSTFIYAPATGQLSSRSPNIQNLPKNGDLAKAYRKTVAARSGYSLIEFDFSGFHSLTFGFEAKDKSYMDLSRVDIHSFLAGHLVGWPGIDKLLTLSLSDQIEILAEIKKLHKKVRDQKAKATIHGMQFGLGGAKLYDMNVESFASKKEAQGVIDMMDSLFPKAKRFKDEVKERAYREKQLVSRHGYLRRYCDVYHYQQVSPRYHPQPWDNLFTGRNGKTYKRVAGEEAEAAISFLPSNDAFGHIKDVMIRCEALGYNERYGLVNTIHDSVLFEVSKVLLDDCLQDVSREMERPSEVLVDLEIAPKGLACGISAGVGKDWASLKEVYATPVEGLM